MPINEPMPLPAEVNTAVIGGGQAGLATSYHLKQRGIAHIVLEKRQIGYAWRNQRWDSFCLVTPNWQCQLPGFPYPGNDPHGFMVKDDIVAYVEAYAKAIEAPATIEVKNGHLLGQAEFKVRPEDFNISIPSLVRDKIDKEITVKVNIDCTAR